MQSVPAALFTGLAAVALALSSGGAAAADASAGAHRNTAGPPGTPETRIEGDWVRTDVNGSGDFGGLSNGYQQAQLTAAGKAEVAAARQSFANRLKPLKGPPHKVGDAYVVVQKPCLLNNLPSGEGTLGLNPDSGAIHIVVSPRQVVVAPERDGLRIIYLDGRAHPPASLLTPTGGGNSVGHFDHGVLLVDTVGMTPGQVPAGGWRLPSTHLQERYQTSADGKQLLVTYTWSDPKVYVKPHSYTYKFDRLPAGSYAFEEWCDPSDPAEYTSIVPPPQQK
jgi:hypothetical protein